MLQQVRYPCCSQHPWECGRSSQTRSTTVDWWSTGPFSHHIRSRSSRDLDMHPALYNEVPSGSQMWRLLRSLVTCSFIDLLRYFTRLLRRKLRCSISARHFSVLPIPPPLSAVRGHSTSSTLSEPVLVAKSNTRYSAFAYIGWSYQRTAAFIAAHDPHVVLLYLVRLTAPRRNPE